VNDAAAARSRRDGWHLWLLAALAVTLFAGFLWIARDVHSDSSLVAWDSRVTDALVGARTPGWDRVFWCLTLLGNTPVMLALASLVVLLLLAWGRRGRAVLVAGALASTWGISSLVKAVVQRARPPEAIALIKRPDSFSLPSGHALLTLVFLGLLVLLAFRGIGLGQPRVASSWRQWLPVPVVVLAAATVVIMVGLSRVYLGVHWASDVLAGWSLGGAWLALLLAGFLIWERGSRPLPDKRPWRGRASRVMLAAVLVLLAAVVVFFAAQADPLLVSTLS